MIYNGLEVGEAKTNRALAASNYPFYMGVLVIIFQS